MALLVTSTGPRALADAYDRVIEELDRQGLGQPAGRRSHVAAIDADGITVADVWDGPEQLDAFATRLVPIVQDLGAPVPEVVARPVHNTIAVTA